MEALDIEKLVSLLSLAALGSVFKYCYQSQRAKTDEEAVRLLLSAIVLSAVLGGLFKVFGFPLAPWLEALIKERLAGSRHGIPDKASLSKARELGTQVVNLGWAAVIGVTLGRFVHAFDGSRTNVGLDTFGQPEGSGFIREALGRVVHFVRLILKPSFSPNLLDEFFTKVAYREWIVVEFFDGAGILGGLMRWDRRPQEKEDSYIILCDPRRFDFELNRAGGDVLSEMVALNLRECKSILVTRNQADATASRRWGNGLARLAKWPSLAGAWVSGIRWH